MEMVSLVHPEAQITVSEESPDGHQLLEIGMGIKPRKLVFIKMASCIWTTMETENGKLIRIKGLITD